MNKINDIISLLRIQQWYKNLLVFLAMFFSGHLFILGDVFLSVLGFFSLSFVSSSYYIINDIVDFKKDCLHPEKKMRPIASGKISIGFASFICIILLITGLYLALSLGTMFFYLVLSLFVLSQLYTFVLKKIMFADILAIATLFVIRAISGAFIIGVVVSPWLILCPFFLALFLAAGKRHGDLLYLEEKASDSRKVLSEYTLEMTHSLMLVSTTLLVMSYALYSFLSEYNSLLYTLPFALFVIFRYFHLISSGSSVARHPEKVFDDKVMVVGLVLWLVVTFVLIYFT